MNNGNEYKNKALGMPYGTATSRLRKSIMFDMAKRLDEDLCYRCGVRILDLEEFSIEHKKSWLYADNPVAAFFSLDNIAFSHILCNIKASKSSSQRKSERSDKKRGTQKSWCSICKNYKTIDAFGLNRSKDNGRATECLDCRKLRNS